MVKKWTETSLILRIAVFLVLGVVLALLVPKASWLGIFGQIFTGALKAIAPVLVFFLVSSALSKFQEGLGKRFRTVIILYIFSTFVSAMLAVTASFLFPVTIKLTETGADGAAPSGIGEVLTNLVTSMIQNPIAALGEGNYIGILFWAVMAGLAMKAFKANKAMDVVEEFAEVITMTVRWIIQCAPFGIMGIVYTSVTENGLSIFKDYGQLILMLVGCMVVDVIIVTPIIVGIILRRNPYKLVFKCMRESGITAFFTRSSAANIPVNMQLCEKLGIEKDFYSICIPLGSTVNMNGAAITINILTLCLAATLGIHVDLPTTIILSFLATLGACGASGVPGGSLMLVPMAASLFGISNDVAMQAVAVGFIISVIQDSMETAINSSGDVIYCATAEFRDRIKNGQPIPFYDGESK